MGDATSGRTWPTARAVHLVVAALLVVGLAACSREPAAAPAPAAHEAPCDLLTKEEIAAAVGGIVDAGIASAPGICAWAGRTTSTSLAVPAAPQEGSACEEGRPEDATDVPEVDATAWWFLTDAGVRVGTLVACPPSRPVTLTVSGGGDEAELRAAAVELAQLLLPRID